MFKISYQLHRPYLTKEYFNGFCAPTMLQWRNGMYWTIMLLGFGITIWKDNTNDL